MSVTTRYTERQWTNETGIPQRETTTETAALNSVELKEDAKGSVRVESYKVYANDPREAERLALEGMLRLRSQIAEAAGDRMDQQLEASVKGMAKERRA